MHGRRMRGRLWLLNSTLLLILLLYSGLVIAQDTAFRRNPSDSGWIEKFSDQINIKLALINTADALVLQADSVRQVLQPNPSELFRLYVNYRFISFYINYVPHFLPGNNDDDEKGRTSGIGLGTSLNFRNWFTDLYFSHTKGYYLENTKDYRPDWQPGDPYFQVPAMHVTRFEGQTGYNTNARHSLPAIISQTERQMKSAGAFIPKILYKYDIIDNRTQGTYSTQKSQNVQLMLGAGYQHTFVVKRSLYAFGGFTPSFGYIFYKVTTRIGPERFTFNNRGPIYQWDAKFGFGYNGHRLFTGTYLSAYSARYAQGLSTVVDQDVSVFFQLFVGVRLSAPRFISKKMDKVFH
ncbi:protein of unknown function [Chitinophaga sp. YR627]|nr:protein of unknown function [Chitinophaga sp. YR627]